MSDPSQPSQPSQPSPYNRKNPFPATLTANVMLNKPGSAKDTRHFVFDLKGSHLSYKVGDCLGVFTRNPEPLVDELLAQLKLDGTTLVTDPDGSRTALKSSLQNSHILNRVGKKFVSTVAEKLPEGTKKAELTAIIEDKESFDQYIFTRDYIDVLKEYPEIEFTAEELLGALPKIIPRLYSIASSIEKHPGEVHLTVAVVSWETHGRRKFGFASGWMGEHMTVGTKAPVFIQPSRHFHLPENTDTDVIMVGPGTGIAPFRAFLEQREVSGAKGRNWLFFGDQHKATDFLYEDEFADYQKQGLLHKLDTAFSRDQQYKIYVQDRLRENAEEIWNWLQNGAYFYVCGDAKRMAKDVHQALIDIATQQGGLSVEDATEYIGTTLMKTEKRYLRDVY